MKGLFDLNEVGRLAEHRVAGFDEPIPAICYAGEKLGSPFPMGGLATGYLELRGDGEIGLCSLFNELTPPRPTSGVLLTLIDSRGKHIPLDAEHAEIHVLAHFPICNVRYAVRNGGPVIWLRVFSPLIPGDAEASNTPGVLFEVSVEDEQFRGRVRLGLDLGEKPFPLRQATAITEPGAGVRLRLSALGHVRSDLVLARLHGAAQATASGETALSLEGELAFDTPMTGVFAWYSPWFKDSGGEPHQHRYGRRFDSAAAVAQFLADNGPSLEQRVCAWQAAVYADDQPDWVANALVQSLYSYAKNALWVDEQRTDRWYEPEGLFVHSESFRGCAISETMVCRQHGHLPLLLLWPELERTTLAGFAHFQLRNGEVPFSFGSRSSLRDPRFHCQHPINSGQFIQHVHRYTERTGDETFLRRLWPNVVDAMHYVKSLDDDNDGLVNEHAHMLPGENWPANQFYDIWPWYGTSAYVAGTWLATLRSLVALARRVDDEPVRQEASDLLTTALASYKEKLWNGRYFRLYHDARRGDNETCLANQLMGQWCCRIAGLDPLFDAETCTRVYQAIDRYNASATDYGLINGGNFQGEARTAGEDPNNNHGLMVFFGENLCASMTGMYEGYEPAVEWARQLVWTVHEHQAMPFDQHCLIRHDNGEPAWGHDYYSNLVVWALPMARRKIGLRQFVEDGSLIEQVLRAGRPAGSAGGAA